MANNNTKAAIPAKKIVNENVIKAVNGLATSIIQCGNKITQRQIEKSDFDKTLIGIVTGRDIENRQYIDSIDETTGEKTYGTVSEVVWTVTCNGTGYRVWQTESDITSIGQQVRLYIPNNNYSNKYAEVIDTAKESYLLHHPKKCQYNHQTKKIIETWELDGTIQDGNNEPVTEIQREYQLYIRKDSQGNDEVYKMDLPDGTSIILEGFFLDKFN